MGWVSKIARRGLFAALLLALLVVSAAGLLWAEPGLVLNERSTRFALRWLAPGASASWNALHWSFRREGWATRQVRLEVAGLTVRLPGFAASGPALKLDFTFTLAGLRPRITRVDRLTLELAEARVGGGAEVPKAAAPPLPLPDLRLPGFASLIPEELDAGRLGQVSLRVGEIVIGGWRGSLDLRNAAPGGDSAAFKMKVEVAADRESRWSLAGNARILFPQRHLTWIGQLHGRAQGWWIHFPFSARWQDELAVGGKLAARHGATLYASPFSLHLGGRSAGLELTRLSLDHLWPRKRLLLDQCRLASDLDARLGYPRNSRLDCAVSLFSAGQGEFLPPLRAQLQGELALAESRAGAVSATVSLNESGQNEFLETKLAFRGKAQLTPGLRLDELGPDLFLAAKLRIPELQRWKAALDATPAALPAPLRVLAGPAELNVALAHADLETVLLKARLATDFRGGGESLVTTHEARIQVLRPLAASRAVSVDDRSVLADVELEAPPLSLGAPPQFLPDSRFAGAPLPVAAPANRATPVKVSARIETGKPVRIRTNLLANEIPVAFDLRFADGGSPTGTISVQPLPISVFQKKADLKFLKLTFHPGSEVGDLNGELDYRNPEVKVKILLLGSTDKPRVDFESDPPLSRQQIVSVLLFNKSVDELDASEASSAGSFSQATADGALGLFSLLFLSSTPVESLSYDPVSQTYSARVRLDQKTTLSVGSDFDRERQMALRRRLGGRWAIRTELHSEQGEPDSFLTLLEWFKRF